MTTRFEAPGPTLQDRLEAIGAHTEDTQDSAEERPAIGDSMVDPVGPFRRLESSRRFHRDTGLGRVYHRGKLSYRENSPTDSLHIVIDGDHIAAHVDRVSPLGLGSEGAVRYSLRRAAAHNIAGMASDLVRLLRGRQGDHRSVLDCKWLWTPADSPVDTRDLLDPTTSAWSVQLEVQVTGSLDATRLRRALAALSAHRPTAADLLEETECPDDEALDSARVELQGQPVAMDDYPPLRARLARHPGGDILMLNLNHAATDGFGALRVLQAIARAYTNDGDVEPLDFLAGRNLPVRPSSARVSKLRGLFRIAVERLRDALARPALLWADSRAEDPGFGFHLVSLSADETSRVVNAERPGTSRNVLLAALHLAIGEWNLEHGTPGRQVGVLVPANLRPPDWPDSTVANFSVTARISTRRRHRANPSAALEAVSEQTTRNKHTRTGTALLAALQRSGLLPLWAKQSLVVLQPLTGNRLVDTALLSNLGWLEEAPAFGADAGEVLHVWFSTPARAPRTLCIGAVTVAGRLHLVFRYPHSLFSARAARRFASCYLEQVRQVAECRWGPRAPSDPEAAVGEDALQERRPV